MKREGTPNGDAAMSFDAIGKALGITRGGAWMAYKSAIRKLKRRRPAQLRVMLQLMAARRSRAFLRRG